MADSSIELEVLRLACYVSQLSSHRNILRSLHDLDRLEDRIL